MFFISISKDSSTGRYFQTLPLQNTDALKPVRQTNCITQHRKSQMSFGMELEVQRESGHPSKVQAASIHPPSLTPSFFILAFHGLTKIPLWIDWAHLIYLQKQQLILKDDLKNTVQQGSFPTAACSCPQTAQH